MSLITFEKSGKSLDDTLPDFHHAIVVFGGIKSIEEILNEDPNMEEKNPADLFGAYINPLSTVSSTGPIRTEESLPIGLSVLRPKLIAAAINK